MIALPGCKYKWVYLTGAEMPAFYQGGGKPRPYPVYYTYSVSFPCLLLQVV